MATGYFLGWGSCGGSENTQREKKPHIWSVGPPFAFSYKQTSHQSKKKRRGGENWELKAEDEETINTKGGKRSTGLPCQHGVT